jgi:hypothetical protein
MLFLYRIDRKKHEANLEHLASSASFIDQVDPITQ